MSDEPPVSANGKGNVTVLPLSGSTGRNAWLGELSRGENGLHPTVANVVTILCNDPELAGIVAYNEFSSQIVICRSPPAPFTTGSASPGPYPRSVLSSDVTLIQGYIQRVYTIRISQQVSHQAVEAAAEQARFHPVKDWLAGLVWDRTPRLATWLHMAFGATKDAYHVAVGTKFLIAAVARVRRPGCKFDHMPILEGLQGIGKSSVLKELFSEDYFTDSLPSALESRDAALGLQGAWVVEFGEIEQIIRAEVEVIKAFLSRSVDRFRAPYGRTFLSYPRQCVLIGTTNDSDYLRDSTGNRRFWPVACTHADVAWIKANREQLFAEAAALEADGIDFWMHEADVASAASVHQADRMIEDVWEDAILTFASQTPSVTVADVMVGVLKIELKDQSKRDQMRIANVLRRHGWKRSLAREQKSKPSRKWLRPVDPSAKAPDPDDDFEF